MSLSIFRCLPLGNTYPISIGIRKKPRIPSMAYHPSPSIASHIFWFLVLELSPLRGVLQVYQSCSPSGPLVRDPAVAPTAVLVTTAASGSPVATLTPAPNIAPPPVAASLRLKLLKHPVSIRHALIVIIHFILYPL